jgi:hypothetical protein
LFKKLKGMRDKVMHGEPFVERELPIGDLSALLRKYVNAYLAAKGSPGHREADEDDF